ncbi:MAG: hypothetical protein ABSB70_05310 [Candidatus Velthaea sp.]
MSASAAYTSTNRDSFFVLKNSDPFALVGPAAPELLLDAGGELAGAPAAGAGADGGAAEPPEDPDVAALAVELAATSIAALNITIKHCVAK